MYNQLLKLFKERQEQEKRIEEKERSPVLKRMNMS